MDWNRVRERGREGREKQPNFLIERNTKVFVYTVKMCHYPHELYDLPFCDCKRDSFHFEFLYSCRFVSVCRFTGTCIFHLVKSFLHGHRRHTSYLINISWICALSIAFHVCQQQCPYIPLQLHCSKLTVIRIPDIKTSKSAVNSSIYALSVFYPS